jgi:Calcineurin-like phosphoesterase
MSDNGKVNIQLLSDLHLESNPHFVPQPAPGADVLVLAGDIGSYQHNSSLTRLGIADFGLQRFANWPVPVIFVPGNHEYDALEFEVTRQRLQDICTRLGLIWLEQEVTVIAGVRFLGCTLWTDFDAMTSARAVSSEVTLGQQLAAREKAFRAADFALKKNHALVNGQPMLAEAVRELGLTSQAWLRQALAQPFSGKTAVVTHFAPSLLSADPRYGVTPGTAGFCNALDDLLPSANLWLHGHLHCASDYGVGGCRVVANPLGYARKNEQLSFKPQICIPVQADQGRQFATELLRSVTDRYL